MSLLHWLAGLSQPDLPDPVGRAEETAWAIARQGRRDEARELREACDHLLTVRRSCLALAEASHLCFAGLWPQAGNGDGPSVRMNVVWKGVLQEPVSLRPDSVEQQIDSTIESVRGLSSNLSTGDDRNLVAVPQRKLDSVLAVSRWFRESDHPTKTIIPSDGTDLVALAAARTWLVAESRALFAMQPLAPEGAAAPL